MDNIKNHIIKCKYCEFVFFDCGQNDCPNCHKNFRNNWKNIFKDFFGNNNPFDKFGVS